MGNVFSGTDGGVQGPPKTEGLANCGDADYDEQMRKLWGGPPPKHFPRHLSDWPERYRVSGKTALVTGGAGGIGFYICKVLAACGYRVVVPKRTNFEAEAEGCARAIKAAVRGAVVDVPEVPLDLESLASVRAFGKALRDDGRAIDVLCLNAGRGGSRGDAREETVDGVEAIMGVNAVSHFLLTCEVLRRRRPTPSSDRSRSFDLERFSSAPLGEGS